MDQGHLWVVRVRARRRGEFVDAITDIQADGKVLIINLQVTPVSAWKTNPVQAVTFPSRCASCTGVNLNLRQHYTLPQSAVGRARRVEAQPTSTQQSLRRQTA